MAATDTAQRLARLIRVREVERTSAACELAQAGAAEMRLAAIATRADRMVRGCAAPQDATDAAALRMLLTFRSEVGHLAAATSRQAEQAARQTLAARQALAAAERRRDLTKERLAAARRACAAERESRSQLARDVRERG